MDLSDFQGLTTLFSDLVSETPVYSFSTSCGTAVNREVFADIKIRRSTFGPLYSGEAGPDPLDPASLARLLLIEITVPMRNVWGDDEDDDKAATPSKKAAKERALAKHGDTSKGSNMGKGKGHGSIGPIRIRLCRSRESRTSNINAITCTYK